MKWFNIVLSGVALAFIAGCGASAHHIQGTSGPTIGPVDSIPLRTDLMGDWAGKCVPNGKTSTQKILHFNSNGSHYSYEREYANLNCKGEPAVSTRAKAAERPSRDLISPYSAKYALGAIHFKSGDDVDAFISRDKLETWDRSGKGGDKSIKIYTRIKN